MATATPKPRVAKCPVCCEQDENYYGRLIFPDDQGPFLCPNTPLAHKGWVELEIEGEDDLDS